MRSIAALLALVVSAAAAPPSQAVQGERATALVTLDGEHPWVFDGERGDWERRAERLRRQVLVAAGLWPLPARSAPEPIVHGEIDRGDYRVRRVLLETRPGFYLTGNLYLPVALDGPAPAVLSPHGHHRDGRFSRRTDEEVARELAGGGETIGETARFHLQARCAQLARLGCVVFHYDMIGYADSRQLGHDDVFTDAESIAWGVSHFGLQTLNSIRALDFLAGLPEVDPARIGVTGASGGGTQTFVLCAIDPRPAAAFPAVMVSSDMQGGCVCENAPHLRVGTSNVELAALFAPRPLALSAADDWTLEVEARGLPQLERVWASFGHAGRVAARTWPEFGHNYNLPAREWMYAWFDRHLELGAATPIREAPFEPIEPAELSVFDADHPLPEDALDGAGLRASLVEEARARLAARVPADERELAEWRRVADGAFEVLAHTSLAETAPTDGTPPAPEPGEVRDLDLPAGDGRGPVRATLLAAEAPLGVVCVAVAGSARGALLDPATPEGAALRGARARGATFLVPEVLLDEGGALPVDSGRHGRYAGYTWCYNRTLIAERARDVLVAIHHARRLPGTRRVVLWGVGDAGPRVLLAAALARPALAGVLVDATWDDDAPARLDDPELLPGASRYGGLAGLAGLCAPLPLTLAGRDAAPPLAVSCYRAAGASAALALHADGSVDALPRVLGLP